MNKENNRKREVSGWWVGGWVGTNGQQVELIKYEQLTFAHFSNVATGAWTSRREKHCTLPSSSNTQG